MDRRELVLGIMATGSVPFLAPSAGHAAARGHWTSQFEASVEPWQPAFATAAADFSLTAARVRGRFPDAVAGTLYRNGPAGHDLGGERYHHWFDGDGMVHRLVIAGTEVHH